MSLSSAGHSDHDKDTAGQLRLTPEQAAALFPFHIVFDRTMRAVQVGPSLAKLSLGVGAGADLRDHLELERPNIPFDADSICANLQILFLLKARDSSLRLRGQMLPLANGQIVYLCSPWIPEPGALRSLGLHLPDFSLHDSMPELVHVVQSQRLAMDDLQRLTEKLRTQRQSLREANDRLKVREAESSRLAMIAARTENCVIVTDAMGRIEWVNESFIRLTEYTLDEVRGRSPGSILQGPATDPRTVAYMRQRIQTGEGFQCEVVNYSKSGKRYWLSIEVQPITDEAGEITCFMAIESNITARKDWERQSRIAYAVTKILAGSLEPRTALESILENICDELPASFGCLWRIDESKREMYCQSLWATPPIVGSDFEQQTRSRRFVPGEGLPGSVWAANDSILLPDLGSQRNFPRGVSAAECGLRSGFAFPVRLSGEIRGAMEFFFETSEAPSPDLLNTLTGLGSQIEQFLERREAEQQRSEVLSLLDSTLESSSEGIMVTDAEGRPVRVNHRWCDLWNLPQHLRDSLDRDEVFRWVDPQLVDAVGRRAVRAELAKVPDATRSDIVELKDGRVFEVISTPHTMWGHIVGRVWTYRDVTETFHSQRIREELLSTLNATLESTADGILVADLNRNIVTCNGRFTEMWNLPPDVSEYRRGGELIKLVLAQVADADAFSARIDYLYCHRDESGFDIVHFLDGSVYERYSQPQRAGNRVIGRVWSYREVTDRWRQDQALRESEQRYRSVMQSATDAIVTVDEDSKIVFASRSAGRVFGYGPDELPGTPVWALVPPELRTAESMRDLTRRSRQRRWQAVEAEALRRDGSRIPVEVSLHRSRVGSKRLLTGVLRDISQRKLADRKLQEATVAAESANRAKSDFLANISHEIRTPLNTIVGLTELLQETRLDAEQRDMVASVWASSESLLHLINDLLDVSKIEAGQVDIESVEFDPVQLGEQVIEILRLRAARKRLPIFFLVDPPSPPKLLGDANRIRQVLLNLLGNALKFTEKGSVTVRLQWREGAMRFAVEDTGIGIPEEVQASVFEKFFRVDTAVGRRAGGAGLGLSISRLLCKAMGGRLNLVSRMGEGSEFSFEVPSRHVRAGEELSTIGLRGLLLASPRWVDREAAMLRSAGLNVDAFTAIGEACAHADHIAAYDIFAVDESAAADADQVRLLLRLAALGKELRSLRIRWSPAEPGLALPGRVADLNSPFTPARVRKAIAELMGESTAAFESAATASPGPPDAGIPGARVLLVEDNPDSQAYAHRVLAKARHHVTVASSGAEAIAKAEGERFDVILMDIMLPDMTGFEATRVIRERETALALRRTPIVALTAHALEDYRREAFTADMDGYVTKPVRPRALLDAVKAWAVEAGAEEVLIDADLVDLAPGYLASVQRQVGELQRHVAEGRLGDAGRIGHNLKGTGSSYGFGLVSEAGRAIEAAAKAGNAADTLALAEALDARLKSLTWRAADP
jgi:two-component system, sensor histidine kinase and response regulator